MAGTSVISIIPPMDRAAILRDYKSLRSLSVPLNKKLAERLTRDEVDEAARSLGMLRGKRIELETEDEVCVLMDHAINGVLRDGHNAIDRMLLEAAPPEGSNELRLLRSMQGARHTILEVHAPIPGLGVMAFDGPERRPILVVDVGFSSTATEGMCLATRIHSPTGGDWWMTTGAALPLTPKALDRIIRSFQEHQRRYGVEPSERERTTLIIRTCVASGASQRISYAAFDKRPERARIAAPIAASSKVGRNDPCPCGSGLKHKKCCGK